MRSAASRVSSSAASLASISCGFPSYSARREMSNRTSSSSSSHSLIPSYNSGNISSLIPGSSMDLILGSGYVQRMAMADTTKAKAGMAGYSDNAYNEAAETFLNAVEEAMVEHEDNEIIEDIDYAAGVLNVHTSKGSFIINKQAPKLQLWLSSPVSGPTHYDMVVGLDDDEEKVWWKCDRTGKNLETLLSCELGGVLGLKTPLQITQ